jgi:hypothetical protein
MAQPNSKVLRAASFTAAGGGNASSLSNTKRSENQQKESNIKPPSNETNQGLKKDQREQQRVTQALHEVISPAGNGELASHPLNSKKSGVDRCLR